MFNKKNRKIIASIICILLVIALVVPLVFSFLGGI